MKTETRRTQKTAIQIEQAAKQFNEMLEELRPVLEAIIEAIREWARIISEIIKQILEAWRRFLLYAKLVRWHCPYRIAKFIANRWPARWLPR